MNELREGSPGCPLYSSPVTHSTELHRGDHVLFQTPQSIPPYRPSFRSGLVLRADDKNIQILSYSKRGIQEESIKFSSSQLLSKVEYTSCRYLSNKAILRAKWRLEARENHYHTLYNNSHYFVTWAKTGVEYPLSEIIDELTFDEGIVITKCVFYTQPKHSTTIKGKHSNPLPFREETLLFRITL